MKGKYISTISLEDVFIFDENVYFSFKNRDDTIYCHGYIIYRDNFSMITSLNDGIKEIEHKFGIEDYNFLERGDYYNHIKSDLNEYCNREVAERIQSQDTSRLEKEIKEFLRKIIREMNHE